MQVRYQGPVDVLLKELRKCAMRGWTLYKDADKIQAALDNAVAKDRARRALAASRGGIA